MIKICWIWPHPSSLLDQNNDKLILMASFHFKCLKYLNLPQKDTILHTFQSSCHRSTHNHFQINLLCIKPTKIWYYSQLHISTEIYIALISGRFTACCLIHRHIPGGHFIEAWQSLLGIQTISLEAIYFRPNLTQCLGDTSTGVGVTKPILSVHYFIFFKTV